MDRNRIADIDVLAEIVALRKESVDRNQSPRGVQVVPFVALRKESVDRNFYYSDKDADWVRRSPQGERG